MCMAKASKVEKPVLLVDADYVVKGFPRVEERLAASNADVWAAIQSEADQLDVEIRKVKAHTTAEQVASGEVSWDDYAGHAVAHAFAEAAAAISELPLIVQETVESTERRAFMICMRVAVVEEILDQNRSEIGEWEAQQAVPIPLPKRSRSR